MKRSLAIALALILSLSLTACGGAGGQQPSGNAGADESAAPDSPGGDEKPAEGERISLEISNEDTEKGVLSAICPAGWYEHSDEASLFFSESETPGDYAKPYIKIGYAPTATLTGGSGEEITFEMGGKSWEGLHNGDYNTYNVTHQLDGGGGLSVVSMGVGPDDAVYRAVIESILVDF